MIVNHNTWRMFFVPFTTMRTICTTFAMRKNSNASLLPWAIDYKPAIPRKTHEKM